MPKCTIWNFIIKDEKQQKQNDQHHKMLQQEKKVFRAKGYRSELASDQKAVLKKL